MVQTALPTDDISTNPPDTWVTESFSSSNRYASIDDSSDSTYVLNNTFGSSSTLEVGLDSSLSTPGAGTRTLKHRTRGDFTETETITVALYEGASLVQSFTRTPSSTVTTYSETVTSGISDYSDLSVRLTTSSQQVNVYEVEFEIPDAGGGGGGAGPKLNPEAFLMFL
jgi:hypothetical protein